MNRRLDRERERKYVLPATGIEYSRSRRAVILLIIFVTILAGFVTGFVSGYQFGPPRIPRCLFAPDIIIGNGDYDRETGYWSEYDCVSESAFSDHDTVNTKSEMQP